MPTKKLITSAPPAFAFSTLAHGFALAVSLGDCPGKIAMRSIR